MFDRYPQASQLHTARAPMMALANPDPALALGDGATLQPTVFLRNTTSAPLPLSAAVNWKSAASRGHFDLPTRVLPPNSVQALDLTQYLGPKAIPSEANWGTVILSYNGQPADLVAFATSFDASGKHGVQTPFSEGTAALWKGGMWHADPMRNTIIVAGNGGSKPVNAGLVLHYDGGRKSYQLEMLLSPGEQMWTNIGDLIANQVPDSSGRSLPPSAASGSYEVIDLDHLGAGQVYEGKIVVDKTYGRGFYGCASCYGQNIPAFESDPASLALGNQAPDTILAYDFGEGGDDDLTDEAYSWTSTTSVITISSGNATAVGVGTSYDSAYVQYNQNNARLNCPLKTAHPRQTHNVCAVPINFQQTNVQDNHDGTLTFTYRWQSSSGNADDLSTCKLGEIVSYPGNGLTYTWPHPPWNNSSSNPTVSGVSDGPPEVNGPDEVMYDTHYTGSWWSPYQHGNFSSTQYYRYHCGCYQNNAFINVMGPNTITRDVSLGSNGTSWVYTLTKTGSQASTILP